MHDASRSESLSGDVEWYMGRVGEVSSCWATCGGRG